MQGKVEICGVNTSRLRLLTAEQMDELLRRTRAGDENAREQLIEGNLRLVLSVIQRFDKRGESPDDLFQVGCVGLLKAISNFDPDKNVRFSTYGVPMIAGEIRRYLRDNSVIRVSRSLRDVAYRVLQCREALTLRLGREPNLDEIAAELELPQRDISAALDAISAPVSLFDPVFTDGGDPLTVMDQVRDTKNNEGSWLEHITLREGFRRLGDREKQILRARFYDGKTQMDVARNMNISQAQVSRLEKGAICELRKYVSVQVS
ncbi:MAG: RNA polymerase sporulation sigma factor SigG [Ruminococcaceae bacterium]|nr:RNA polymerase sporulation sigma factor SigG [Oscillospiraceae bacterium]